MEKYQRWAKSILEKALTTRRVIIISGARQIGKTTLAEQAINDNAIFRTLDDTTLLPVALDDPRGFLEHDKKTLVIDEIQKAPLLLPEIKRIVDKNNSPGQFVLTGSSDVRSNPKIKESLAGRIKNIRLHGLSEGEIQGCPPNFIERLFNQDFPSQIKGCSKALILQLALRGGYPEVVKFDKAERKEWFRDYLDALIEHDLKDIASIKNEDALRVIIHALSAWSGKLMDMEGICSACGISKPTLKEYIALIERLYLCDRVHPWTKTDYDMVGRTDKMYMTDTGLMAATLGWHYDTVAFDADRFGKLIETFVFNELSAQIDLNSDYTLRHYRDRRNREIDFIVENDQGDIVGIEVKGGSGISKEDFKHLQWFKNNLVKSGRFTGIVLYSGENTLPFGENMMAVPTACLWCK
ncbi:MAG: ATP-binding protein [Alphaproteobacteria bacterium]|nr:ATP-binding protein [Alphaproteobacteria bacterium]